MNLRLFRNINSNIPHGHIWIIGNFDGLHKGHFTLIQKAIGLSKEKQNKIGLLSFSPHPKMFFNPSDNPINIIQISEKLLLLNELNIDFCYLHPFNHQIADMSPLDFCHKIEQQLNPSNIVVGYDFHFGKKRAGTPETLAGFCQNHQINCHIIPPALSETGERYASQTIRKFLSEGNISAVRSFLPHDYIISGRVIHGHKKASTLGFPTANIRLENLFLPKFGVYKCRVLNMNNRLAIVNIGTKPTIYNNHIPLLEVHIPNFQGNLYGQKLRVAFDDFIRPEQKFSSLDALKEQIHKDIQGLYI